MLCLFLLCWLQSCGKNYTNLFQFTGKKKKNFNRINAEPILVLMGQDPSLASMAQVYIIISIPYMFLCFTNTALRKFLQSIGIA